MIRKTASFRYIGVVVPSSSFGLTWYNNPNVTQWSVFRITDQHGLYYSGNDDLVISPIYVTEGNNELIRY